MTRLDDAPNRLSAQLAAVAAVAAIAGVACPAAV
jgi:hypothetical protein